MTEDIARIAAGLTEAQKRAVITGHETLFGKQVLLSAKVNCRTVRILENKGLALLHDPYRMRLTPLGLQVRNHLERTSK
jgi:hypothetical protein